MWSKHEFPKSGPQNDIDPTSVNIVLFAILFTVKGFPLVFAVPPKLCARLQLYQRPGGEGRLDPSQRTLFALNSEHVNSIMGGLDHCSYPFAYIRAVGRAYVVRLGVKREGFWIQSTYIE